MRNACTVMIRLAAAFAFVLPAVVVAGCGDASPTPPPGGTPGRSSAGGSAFLASRPIQSVNGKIDFGPVSPCGGDISRTEQIRNQSSGDVEILGYASNCACLEAELLGSKKLAPGDVRDVKLTVHPSGSGVRSVAVEFAYSGGFAGVMRIEHSMTGGANAFPDQVTVRAGDRPAIIDIDVIASDGAAVRALSIDPPIGSILPPEGKVAKVALSSFEAARFAASPEGRAHRGFRAGPDGKPASLVVDITTDAVACPVATVKLTFDP
jgi:hypothetical protein